MDSKSAWFERRFNEYLIQLDNSRRDEWYITEHTAAQSVGDAFIIWLHENYPNE